MRRAVVRRLIALLRSARLVLGVGVGVLCVVFLPAAAVAGASSNVPHEHLPHTSSALRDITTFTKTFDAPPPKPGSPNTPVNAQRVRLANDLPPSNRLSAPIIVLAASLVLLGFLLHPFRKARREKRFHEPDSIGHLIVLPNPPNASSSEELVLQIGSK
jgi:hypothetical protein